VRRLGVTEGANCGRRRQAGAARHQYPNGRNNPNEFAMTSFLLPFFLAHTLR
jgi:hypothetical protein